MKSFRTLLIGILLVGLLALAGCGGSGTSINDFVGTWTGSYTIRQGGNIESAGNLEIEIFDNGFVEGFLDRTDQQPQTQQLRQGFLDSDEILFFVFNYNNTNDREVEGEIRRSGNVLTTTDSQGIQVRFAGGGTGQMTFTLSRVVN